MEKRDWRLSPDHHNNNAQELLAIREAIDHLDKEIASLLQNRLLLARQIGGLKAETGRPVKDTLREKQVLENVQSVTDDPLIADALAAVYSTLMNQSCALQGNIVRNGAPSEDNTPEENRSRDLCDSSTKTLYFPRVLIVGMGLIGSTMARQIKKHMPSTEILACDSAAVLKQARDLGLIDEAFVDISVAVSRASLIILCAPPRDNLQLLKQIAPHVKRRQVVIDVTSTKVEICQLAEKLSLKADFVGGHPFFGSQRKGLEASEDVAVEGKTFCLVTTDRTSDIALRRVIRWLTELRLAVEITDARCHDNTVASTSHLVQILSIALGSMLSADTTDSTLKSKVALSGPALASLGRLMSSPADLWVEIAGQNKVAICNAIDQFSGELQEIKEIISTESEELLCNKFSRAAKVSRALEQIHFQEKEQRP